MIAADIVWINWKDYTGLEFFFYGGGSFLWVIAYVIYIRNILRYKYVEMPVFAGCCDVAWEFVWSFLAVNNMGMLFQAANYVWFFLDAGFIFTYGVLFFGDEAVHAAAAPEAIVLRPDVPVHRAGGRPGRPTSCRRRDGQRRRRPLGLPDPAVDLVPLHPADAAAGRPALLLVHRQLDAGARLGDGGGVLPAALPRRSLPADDRHDGRDHRRDVPDPVQAEGAAAGRGGAMRVAAVA